jgi:nucleotide-binding universal stress UspA family protein
MFRKILLPIDRSARSRTAVPHASELAKSLGAEVLVLHVLTGPVTPSASAEEPEAADYVAGVAKRLRKAGVKAKTRVQRGDAATGIRGAAIEWGADAVVMATRGRQGLQKLVLGSVAEAVVRDSHVPVLLISTRVRPGAKKAA